MTKTFARTCKICKGSANTILLKILVDKEYKAMRNKTIDYTKFMAVVLVILGHCLDFGNGKDYYIANMQTDNFLHNYI